MHRDELLAKGYTEEQVTDILNTFHGINKENEKLKSEILQKAEIESKYNEVQSKLDQINKANLSEQEKIQLDREEASKALKEAKKIKNTALAMQILSGYDIEDDLLSKLVSDDEQETLSNANLLKNRLTSFKETVEKQTKESIANLDVKPAMTNKSQDSDVMTWDKFINLSQEEQTLFQAEHPTEFENL